MSNFVTLLKVCDRITPGSVDWSKGEDSNMQKNWDLALATVNNILDSAQAKSFKLNEQMLMRLTIALDRYRYYNWLGLDRRGEILEWVADRVHLAEEEHIDGFADPRWADGKWLCKLLQKLHPEEIDMEQVNANDAETNANLVIDKSLQFGVKMYCLIDDITNPCKDSIRVLVSGILDKYVEKAGGLLSTVLDPID